MNSKLFAGMDSAQKKETKELLSICKPVLDKLGEMCYNSLDSTRKEMRVKTNYDKPSWSAYQAHLNGYEQAYTEILNIINSIEER